MFTYYLDLARRSLRRNAGLTALMILAIAFGVGASMTTLTVMRALAADPLPGKSGDVYFVQLDPRGPEGYAPGKEPSEQLTRTDAETLLRDARGQRQAMMTGCSAAIEPDRTGLDPFFADTRCTSADFFAMFGAPFVAGAGWTAADDARASRVAVVSRALAEKLFGATDAVGREIRVAGAAMRIVGVLDHWRPAPYFFDLNVGPFNPGEDLFVPFSTSRELKIQRNGSMDCWKEDPDPEALDASCVWIQYWVELPGAARAAAYRDYLERYSQEQRTAGRYGRPPNVRLRDVREWLAFKEVVPRDARLQMWVALGFLVVCLVNTVGLLLTKFLRRSLELGVRRALGASKRAIFFQLLVEAGAIGLAGGALGLGLAWLGLWAVRHQPVPYAELAQLDLPMLAATFGLAVVSALLAGLLPAWRGCQLTPAIQLKSQ